MMKGKYLITTDNFFTAPDGKEYNAVWGNVEILEDSFLGVKTNARSSNWYAKIGSENKHVIIAGCQIHYAVKSEKEPYTENGQMWTFDIEKVGVHKTPTKIYIAE
ncbi:MAG TPA: hypothetical protein VFM82_12135 [Flavobacteriaceae bacterium]|nr:hypothetical protein [Flavobacteriaceae bacterium]